jgi:hypothetical protein
VARIFWPISQGLVAVYPWAALVVVYPQATLVVETLNLSLQSVSYRRPEQWGVNAGQSFGNLAEQRWWVEVFDKESTAAAAASTMSAVVMSGRMGWDCRT